MQAAASAFVGMFGYAAIAALIVLESVFPPIPSEVVLPFAGFLANETSMTLPLVVLAATVGSVGGSFVLYGIGRKLTPERLRAFFGTRPMRMLGFRASDVGRAVEWFERRGQASVLLCRFVPGMRSLISVPAGTARMEIGRFALLTALGSAAWNAALCVVGFEAGSAWESAATRAGGIIDAAAYAALAVAVLGLAWWIWRRVIPNLRRQA